VKEPAVERLEQALSKYGIAQGRAIRNITYELERSGTAWYPGSQWSTPDPSKPVHVSWGDHVVQFEAGQLPLLEGIAARLEAEGSKPIYAVRTSRAVENTVAERAEAEDGFLKLAKAAAHMVIPTGNPAPVVEGMRAYAELAGSDFPVTLAAAHQCLLVFAMSEEDALDKVRSIVVPKKRAAPEKVAVKMVLLRIRKLHAAVRDANVRLAEELASEDSQSRMMHLAQEAKEPIPPVPTDGDRAALVEYLNTVLAVRTRTQYNTQELRKEVLKILRREDMTDAALGEALRIAQVEEVMDS
jgi:hypothetical protein